MSEKTQTAREVSQQTGIIAVISAVAFAISALYMLAGTDVAGQFAANMAVVFVLFGAFWQLAHLLTYDDTVRKYATRVIPKRWLGMEVSND